MGERIDIGVVGCGFFAQNHLHAWTDLAREGVRLAAVCDLDPEKAKAAAERFGVPRWYTDADEMFRGEKLGLVDIVTRMETHRDQVERAILYRVPTIVQKPFGRDLAECVAMTAAAKSAGVFLAVHENFRFQRPMRKVLEILKSGAIGEPTWARISFRTGYDIYKGQPYLLKEERFVVIDLGVHVLDLTRAFLGEARHVSAETQKRDARVSGEDTATMMIRHTSGAVSVVECTYESRRTPDCFPQTIVEIEGPSGAIVLRRGYTMEVTVNGQMTSLDASAPLLSWTERPWHVVQESVFATCAHMLNAIQHGRHAETSAEDNLRTFALAEAAYEAAMSGRSADVVGDPGS